MPGRVVSGGSPEPSNCSRMTLTDYRRKHPGRIALGSFAKHQAYHAITQSRYDWTYGDHPYGPRPPQPGRFIKQQ